MPLSNRKSLHRCSVHPNRCVHCLLYVYCTLTDLVLLCYVWRFLCLPLPPSPICVPQSDTLRSPAQVRFLSGDRLATVHAAPDYDRGIASDLLDQQRQRDRLRRWRQDVDLRVAPVVSAVLAPEHRQRVLRERPELVRSS